MRARISDDPFQRDSLEECGDQHKIDGSACCQKLQKKIPVLGQREDLCLLVSGKTGERDPKMGV